MEAAMNFTDRKVRSGYIKIDEMYFEKLVSVFEKEGFNSNILQEKWPGQLWGGAKLLNYHNEWHIRLLNASDGYENFLIVESEIEIPRDKLEHLLYPSDYYYGPLLRMLSSHGIPFQVVGSLPPIPTFVERPTRYTEWKPLLLISLSFCVGIVLIWAPTKVK
jgi:hypothetical protein